MSSQECERVDAGPPQPAFLLLLKHNQAVPAAAHAHWPCQLEADADVIARLEWLDDLMFAAIDGDPAALDNAADAWNQARTELGDETVEESRLQYLRRAQTIWHALRHQPNHPPHKVFAAIEIISLLAKKAK